jgi:TonB family protein
MHFSAYIMLHMIPKRCMLALVAVVSFAGMRQSQELRKVSNEEATERLTKRVPPQYPPLALTAHIQGSVAIEITITETGSVENMRALSGHPILVQSAMDAVRQWEFDPFKEDGKPVAVLASIKVDFQLGPGAEHRGQYLQQEVECTKQIQSNKPAQAEAACKKALEIAVKLPRSFESDKMRAYGNAGTAAYANQKRDEALEDFKQQLNFAQQALQSGNAMMVQVRSNLAHTYEATGNLQQADVEYTETEKAQEAAMADLVSRKEKLKPNSFESIQSSYAHNLQVVLQEHVRVLRKLGKVSEAEALEQKASAVESR